VILISDEKKYCFRDSPKEIREELESLKIPAIVFDNCSTRDNILTVCFGGEACDISVTPTCDSCQNAYETGTVKTKDGGVSYIGNLIYPAIFSSRPNYECNVKRLLYRGGVVALILSRKADLMNARDCSTNLGPVMVGWSMSLMNATVNDIVSLYPSAVEIEETSKWEVCGLW
jgi:hypothetical protein